MWDLGRFALTHFLPSEFLKDPDIFELIPMDLPLLPTENEVDFMVQPALHVAASAVRSQII